MAEKLIIFGNTDAARQMFYNFSGDSPYQVVCFTTDQPFIREPEFLGLPVVPFTDLNDRFPPRDHFIFVAIGYSEMNRLRTEKYLEAKSRGYRLASYISPKAHIGQGCLVGENCLVGAGCALQPLVKVGNNVVIRENVFIGSGSEVKDHCYISGAAAIAGNVIVGPASFIGINATVKDKLTIGRECIIGAGVTLLHDANDREVYMDNSARKLPFTSERIKI